MGQIEKINWIFLLFLSISVSALASPVEEITHLLAFVESTDCTYERNGDKHRGSEAVKHISRKYEYFSDKIETAEDFIRYSATKSRMSGKYYTVHCEDQPTLKSRDWLLIELERYRSAQ